MYFSLFLWQMSTKSPKGSDREDARKPRPRPTYVKKDVAASALRPYAACHTCMQPHLKHQRTDRKNSQQHMLKRRLYPKGTPRQD